MADTNERERLVKIRRYYELHGELPDEMDSIWLIMQAEKLLEPSDPPADSALAELLLRLEIQSTNNHVAKDKCTASADYCEGIAKGFDECLRIVKKHAAALRALAVPQSAPAGFVEWLCQEMPPGTVISDPAWWAPKIHRAMLAASKEDGK